MPPKRKRRASPSPKGLAAGEPLKRSTLAGTTTSQWGWVGSEVSDASDITQDHLLATCGLSKRNFHPFCRNKCARKPPNEHPSQKKNGRETPANGELEEDIIIISSDDEDLPCDKKKCRNNPHCLNYLGQEKWEDEDDAREMFLKATNLGDNPILDARDPDLPVGLKNLGATCYANASLQVWFRDLAFRSGVYKCQPSGESEHKFKVKESPIFQLQVTFAALQESTQSIFNPTKLVESLQLRTAEQQDAQEFSKLFMSHLDAEFKKQSIPSVQSLITDQFQGKLAYGTICSKCSSISERATNFLEIEINFENNSKLEDRIAALLQRETLSGDNQYLCSQCDSLQDAIRYTKLCELPPVLHFSLLRFVYDVSTMERKKSKHVISFPTVLNMSNYLGDANTRKLTVSQRCDANIYELRGVLLHKGASAYHGHYEAQVYDSTQTSWFQFNDEIVTKIKTLGDKRPIVRKSSVLDVEASDNETASGTQARSKQRANARKRQRVDDSDDEQNLLPEFSNTGGPRPPAISQISSKDAYMLIYALREPSTATSHVSCPTVNTDSPDAPIPVPPPRAMEAIKTLNGAHDESCELFAKREKAVEEAFQETRRKVMEIYRTWSLSSADERFAIVSQQALRKWLSQHCIETGLELSKVDEPVRPTDLSDPAASSGTNQITLQDILCPHGRYDHRKANDMKCIAEDAYEKILKDTNCSFDPRLTCQDICQTCVNEAFEEHLYQTQHPRHLQQFDEIPEVEVDAPGYWISKPWLRDWRLVKPKMHVLSKGDPAPDESEFRSHVRCEHDELSLNTTNRRRISIEACEFLVNLFPSWLPLSTEAELCAVCDAMIHFSKGDRLEVRRRAEGEKARLKHMYDNALNGNNRLLDDVPCAIVSSDFIRKWRHWLNRPTEVQRPDSIDNTLFICEHDMLVFDPNSDLDSSLVVIKRSDWNELETLYSGGPLIAIEKGNDTQYIHNVPVCEGCRQRRKSEWTTTEITVYLRNSVDPSKSDSSNRPTVTYSSRGARQSKRLRQAKEQKTLKKVTISKSTTVKDLKVELQEELDIPTICQRLFYGGRELDDNAATVESLGILANDDLELREQHEIHELSSDSDDVAPPNKRRREEGRAFGGTLLGRTVERSSSPVKPPPSSSPVEKPCSACTFSNSATSTSCEMCDTVFA